MCVYSRHVNVTEMRGASMHTKKTSQLDIGLAMMAPISKRNFNYCLSFLGPLAAMWTPSARAESAASHTAIGLARTCGNACLWPSIVLALIGLATVASRPAQASPQPLVLTNGKVYTGNGEQVWAEAVGVKDDKIVFVGSSAQARVFDSKAKVVDLHGAFVMPGMIDAHTHPGMVSMLGSGDEKTDAALALPSESKAALFAWLRDYAAKHPDESVVFLVGWSVGLFLPGGPDKKDLDAIWPHTPVFLLDNTGHSFWANSTMLKLLGVGPDAKDLIPGVSIFARDANGEPTGWLKEFIVMDRLAPYFVRPDDEIRRRMKAFLGSLAARGITSLWDAGNYGLEDKVYGVLATMDRANELPVRYFGSYHIWNPKQFAVAVGELKRLQAAYGGHHLIFNTVKIHFDGVSKLATAGEYIPYASDPNNRGGIVADTDQLARFFVELDNNGINVHLHTNGDRASDTALNAVQKARKELGRPLKIMVTLAHLETVKPGNFQRFKKLNVTANFTPVLMFGWGGSNKLAFVNLGPERATRRYQAGTMVRSGANVSLSSDIIASQLISLTDPWLGLQASLTRQSPANGGTPVPPDQPDEVLTLPQALRAYTLGGAIQLAYGDKTGTLEVGKLADLLVIESNPFETPKDEISKIKVRAVMMDGEVTAGSLD